MLRIGKLVLKHNNIKMLRSINPATKQKKLVGWMVRKYAKQGLGRRNTCDIT